jgi:hypothetical protein
MRPLTIAPMLPPKRAQQRRAGTRSARSAACFVPANPRRRKKSLASRANSFKFSENSRSIRRDLDEKADAIANDSFNPVC